MKLRFVFLLFAIFLFSCDKEKIYNPEIPDWFIPQIEELESNDQCFGCSITRLSYNNSIYYDLYCSYWSTKYRHLYDSEGNHIEWEDIEEFNLFLENKSDETVIWNCGD